MVTNKAKTMKYLILVDRGGLLRQVFKVHRFPKESKVAFGIVLSAAKLTKEKVHWLEQNPDQKKQD